MKVKIESSKQLKPLYDSDTKLPATDVTVPLTAFDAVTYDTHIAIIYAYRPPTPPIAQIEHSLARILAVYREWAGHLVRDTAGKPAILLNDKGVRFVEASVDVSLEKAGLVPLEPSPALLSLHPPLEGVEELLQCQLTRFACGTLVIGFTSHHMVADGNATSDFLVNWGRVCRGLQIETLPLLGRGACLPPVREPVHVPFEHRGVEFLKLPVSSSDSDNECITEDDEQNSGYEQDSESSTEGATDHDDETDHGHHSTSSEDEVVIHKASFSTDFLFKLKSIASAGRTKPFSTFESLQAHLWRTMTRVRGLSDDTRTQIRISVGGRQRLRPRVPNEYFGNLVLWAFPTTTAGDLLANPLAHAAKIIHDDVTKVDDAYFRSFLNFAESGDVEREGLQSSAVLAHGVLCPNIEVDSWLRFPFYDLDFGHGGPFVFMPTYFPIEGMIFLAPSFLGDGNIDAFVPLFRKNLHHFKNICYSLDD